MGGEQEVSFRQLVMSAAQADLQGLIDRSALTLLKKLRPDVLAGEELLKLVITAGTARDYLLDPERRPRVFDLLSTSQARLLLSHLDLPATENPHSVLRDASPQLSGKQLDAVIAFFGAEESSGLGGKGFAPSTQDAAARYPLFPHQRKAMRRVQEQLYAGTRRVILHMPTGAGKTRTAMHVVSEHIRNNEPAVVIWLAFSEELLEQAASEFEASWGYLGNRNVTLVRFWGGRKGDLTSVEDGLIVAGLGKMYAASQRDLNFLPVLGDNASLIVMDEAHQSIAETYAFVLDILGTKQPTTSMLGLTATPGRSYSDIEQDKFLARFWDGKKVTLEVEGYKDPVQYLIAEGYLARPEFRTINVKPGLLPTSADLERMQASLDLPDDILAELTGNELWNTALIEATCDLLSRHRRVLVFATSVRQAVVLSAVIRALGFNARTVTGTTPKAERESVLQQYTSNSIEPMVLFNYGVLTTGFDAPATSAAVVARPTRSLVLFSQMIGRAMRGPRAGGNDRAEIVTVIDPSLPGFGDPAEAFTNWEDVW